MKIIKDCSQLKGEISGWSYKAKDLILVIRNQQRGKAPADGQYQITYEHIFFGAERVVQAVVRLTDTLFSQRKNPSLFGEKNLKFPYSQEEKNQKLCVIASDRSPNCRFFLKYFINNRINQQLIVP